MQPWWRSARPRWRSGRRRLRSAGCGAGLGWRRPSVWRWSAPSAGEQCACRARALSPRSRFCSPVSPRSPICGIAARDSARRLGSGGRWRCLPWSRPHSRSSPRATSAFSAPASTPTCLSICWLPTVWPTATAPSSSIRVTRSVPTRSSSPWKRASASA